jgi:hypothetical protein
MVNYDLPWNPNRIEQRFGRCESREHIHAQPFVFRAEDGVELPQ